MANKAIIKNAQRAVERYICKIQPLSKGEKEELWARIKLAIKDYESAGC